MWYGCFYDEILFLLSCGFKVVYMVLPFLRPSDFWGFVVFERGLVERWVLRVDFWLDGNRCTWLPQPPKNNACNKCKVPPCIMVVIYQVTIPVFVIWWKQSVIYWRLISMWLYIAFYPLRMRLVFFRPYLQRVIVPDESILYRLFDEKTIIEFAQRQKRKWLIKIILKNLNFTIDKFINMWFTWLKRGPHGIAPRPLLQRRPPEGLAALFSPSDRTLTTSQKIYRIA